MKSPPFQLNDASLEFARSHIKRFYASDFFPDVPEFEAIWAAWPHVKELLKSWDIAAVGGSPLIAAAPKSGGGYRVVHQLQPLDSLVYTALAHQAAMAVEQKRAPKSARIVSSYRIALGPEGRFFDEQHNGYKEFHDRSAELASTSSHTLAVDIASFYNHIYVHRLQNAIEKCDPTLRDLSRAVEEFLLNVSQRQSVGIPVGPAASIIFSEAVLIDVDEFLASHFGAVPYVRYVDDFRFFADSPAALEEVHHQLTSYLYRAHRLTLAAGKTQLLSSDEFVETILEPPEDAEEAALREEVESLMDSWDEGDYESVLEDIDLEDLSWDKAPEEARREALEKLFKALCERPVLDVGMARHLLRRARRSRVRSILPQVIASAAFLLPVFRDVGLYLQAVLSPEAIERNMARFELMARDERLGIPFARHWLRWLFSSHAAFAKSRVLEAFVMGAPEDLRAQAAFARTNGRASWVKNQKDEWRNLGAWDRRSLIFAGEVLAITERNVWMDAVTRNPVEPLDGFIAGLVRGK